MNYLEHLPSFEAPECPQPLHFHSLTVICLDAIRQFGAYKRCKDLSARDFTVLETECQSLDWQLVRLSQMLEVGARNDMKY